MICSHNHRPGSTGELRNKGDRVFAGWGSWVARFRWPVLVVALAAVVASGIWGLGVFGQLSEGGYNDPNGESTRAAQIVQQSAGAPAGDVVAIYTPANGKIDDAALGKRIRARLAALPKSAVKSSTSYWQQKSAQYAAKDKSSAVAVITLAGADDPARLASYREIDDKFAVDGAPVRLAGSVALADASSSRSTSDLGTAEMISLPITLILLLFLFGSLVAASLPVLVGGSAVLGSLGVLHAIAAHHQVNSFAVNVASLLGLGMAIDYGLFMVGRFREEQAEGRTPAEAVRRTVGTAGRTVVFSATLLMIALAGLLLFPQGFLKSLAYGGLSAVALAATLSLTLLPALLAILGPRVDKLPVRLPRRVARPAGNGWARLADRVLRRPVLVAVPILAGLLVLAAPITGVRFGENDERILPAGDSARVALETLKADYPQLTGDSVQLVLRGTQNGGAFPAAARRVPGVAEIGPARKTAGGVFFTARLTSADPFSPSARDAVDGLRALPLPAGAQLLVGGTTAANLDSLHATAAKLPLMVALLVGATLLLMFLAFGSVLLPIKAVVMSALSLSATFGVLVWIFDAGNGAALLGVTPAPLEAGIVVLMAAVVFGLSTDYEVFLLSRMVEARTRGASSAEAVRTGLARTGRVISAAALLLIVVTGAFALSSVTTMRFVGVGMIVALLLDATVVRMLLVPAVLGLLGDAAWWAPGPLRRLQQRARLAEYAGEDPSPSGRHAAPDDTEVLTGIVGYGPREADDTVPLEGPGDLLLHSDEDKPAWARPSGAMAALPAAVSPFALPAAPVDEVAVFPVYPGETAGLNTVRMQLPAGPVDPDDVAAVLDESPSLGAAPAAVPALVEADPGLPASAEPDPGVSALTEPDPGVSALPEPDSAIPEPGPDELPVYSGETAGLKTVRIGPSDEPADTPPAEPAEPVELPVYSGETAGLDTLRILPPAAAAFEEASGEALISAEAGAESYAALFPELFGGAGGGFSVTPAWSAPATDYAQPEEPAGFGYAEPVADERYVVPTLADRTDEDLTWFAVGETDAAPAPSDSTPISASASASASADEPEFRPVADPVEASSPAEVAGELPAPRRPADLSMATGVRRRGPDDQPPARPEDLAGYVDGSSARPDAGRPTDLGSYAPDRPAEEADDPPASPRRTTTAGWRPPELGPRDARPADLAQYSRAWAGPAADERVRRPASLADHLPPARSGGDGESHPGA